MAYGNKITTSQHGRRLGLQSMSSSETGGAKAEFLVGPDDFRVGVDTAETTSTNLNAFGISGNLGTSAGSSAVYTLDPPIPGVRKVIASSTANGPVYVNLGSGVAVVSSAGSTHATVKLSTLGNAVELVGLTTALWLTRDTTGAGHTFAAST